MSRLPEVELSSQYTYLSAAMAEGLEKIMEQDYAIKSKEIPKAVLSDAKELFNYAISVMNNQNQHPKEVTGWIMVLDHLRKINPKKYEGDIKRKVIYQDVRNLASLLDNLGKLEEIPEDQREYVPVLKKFFELLSETGENARYQEVMGGKPSRKYIYS